MIINGLKSLNYPCYQRAPVVNFVTKSVLGYGFIHSILYLQHNLYSKRINKEDSFAANNLPEAFQAFRRFISDLRHNFVVFLLPSAKYHKTMLLHISFFVSPNSFWLQYTFFRLSFVYVK